MCGTGCSEGGKNQKVVKAIPGTSTRNLSTSILHLQYMADKLSLSCCLLYAEIAPSSACYKLPVVSWYLTHRVRFPDEAYNTNLPGTHYGNSDTIGISFGHYSGTIRIPPGHHNLYFTTINTNTINGTVDIFSIHEKARQTRSYILQSVPMKTRLSESTRYYYRYCYCCTVHDRQQ